MKRDVPNGEAGLLAKDGPWPVGTNPTGLKKSFRGFGSLLRRSGSASKNAAASDKAPRILELLTRKKFFEKLDDRLCPADSAQARAWCQGGFEITGRILAELGMDEEDIQEVIAALQTKGSDCDCGVLYHVTQESRLKTEYWLARALNDETFDPHSQMPRT
jgi:hypothetical protein